MLKWQCEYLEPFHSRVCQHPSVLPHSLWPEWTYIKLPLQSPRAVPRPWEKSMLHVKKKKKEKDPPGPRWAVTKTPLVSRGRSFWHQREHLELLDWICLTHRHCFWKPFLPLGHLFVHYFWGVKKPTALVSCAFWFAVRTVNRPR